MQTYNKIMLYFWLAAGIISFIAISIMGFMDGFKIWMFYYIISAMCFVMYFFRKWMIKRYEKHIKWLAENHPKTEN